MTLVSAICLVLSLMPYDWVGDVFSVWVRAFLGAGSFMLVVTGVLLLVESCGRADVEQQKAVGTPTPIWEEEAEPLGVRKSVLLLALLATWYVCIMGANGVNTHRVK